MKITVFFPVTNCPKLNLAVEVKYLTSGSPEKVGKVPKFGEKRFFLEFTQKLAYRSHVLNIFLESL